MEESENGFKIPSFLRKTFDVILSGLLTVIFILVFTPVGLILRLTGKDYMQRKIQKKIHSYWISR
ncbi:MAG: Saxitoxin biosynthesis operon protein SxtJ [Thermodesulfobacteriota bacterium]|nr:Saxitoxin biosynthesis operon protein SxtJ [Thermodesulfobacteriota bacterium]